MSKIAVFVIPAYGHIHPILPLIKELVDRGHELVFYAAPEFETHARNTGARYEELDHPKMLEIHQKKPHLLHLFRITLEATLELTPPLIERVRAERFDFVITDFMTIWGRLVCQLLQLPKVVLHPVFALNKQINKPRLDALLPFLRRPIDTIRHLRGIDKISRKLDKVYACGKLDIDSIVIDPTALAYIVFVSKTMQPLGESFDARYKFVGTAVGSSPGTVQFPFEQLDARKPLVYISLGTVFNDDARFFKFCIKSLKNTDYQVVMAIGNKLSISDLGTIPDNFIVRDFVPQNQILERAAVFITHGGMNSCSDGIFHRVPMIMNPQQGDQFIVAQRVIDNGAGLWPSWRWMTGGKLRRLIEQARQSTAIRSRLEALSAAHRASGGHLRAADEIESLFAPSLYPHS